jgi:L-ascorbate metabolism protein UlaG (beta-lactamase superfamily)
MRISWYGQSAFLIQGDHAVFIDPFGPMEGLEERGLQFAYPPIEGASADLLLVTHEHGDHNAVEVIGGSPEIIRSTAGTFESPVGQVRAIASEHDDVAGTQRGPNSIFCFTLNGLILCHFGDFGQTTLRSEQREAIGKVDVLFLPIGGGPTIDGAAAAAIVRELQPRLVVPMHYQTAAVNFLEPPDAFLDALGAPVGRSDTSTVDVEQVLGSTDAPSVVLPAAPGA